MSDKLDIHEKYRLGYGSPFDRGGADSYYHRPRKPHKVVSATDEDTGYQFFETITDLTPEEVEAYQAGYDENEELGDKKDWG